MTAIPKEATTAHRILRLIKEKGGAVPVKSLCAQLDLSPMAVHRQLGLLQGEGLIRFEELKGGMGRPLRLYYLTDEGHESFQRDYPDLAIDLLLAVRKLDGKDKINELFAYLTEIRLEKARRRVRGKTLEARVFQVSRLLSEEGYMATWEKLAPNQYLIKLMNCAVEQVARRFPRICVCEEQLIAELLQANVSRGHHILQKEQYCSYLVESEAPSS